MIAVLALAASALPALHWEGRAKVYAGDRVIPIAVRTSVAANGDVVSESWPEALGEAKGLRRMTIKSGAGETFVNGTTAAMPGDMLAEEQAQFGIYRQIQEAFAKADNVRSAGANTLSVAGPARSWFTLGDREVKAAVNWLPAGEGGALVRQDFRFDGWWRSNGAFFPRRMILTRDGKPYFELDVTRFDAR